MFKRLKPAVLIEILLHLLFWAFITLTPILSRPRDPNFRVLFSPWHFVFVNLLLAVQFYLNAFFLIPVCFNRHVIAVTKQSRTIQGEPKSAELALVLSQTV